MAMGFNSGLKGLKIRPDILTSMWAHFMYLLQRIPTDRPRVPCYGNVIG